MSSRSRRADSSAPVSSTPLRPQSPTSPTRTSRIHEKQELQALNDRLAGYIDRVRYLEAENSRLTVEVRSVRESVTRESSNIKQMFEHELADARKVLDETAREKAKLEIDVKRLSEENDDLRCKYVDSGFLCFTLSLFFYLFFLRVAFLADVRLHTRA